MRGFAVFRGVLSISIGHGGFIDNFDEHGIKPNQEPIYSCCIRKTLTPYGVCFSKRLVDFGLSIHAQL